MKSGDHTMREQTHFLRTFNIEYALVQGFYWISFCGIITYAAVFLQDRGYSNLQLGQILAIGHILGLLLPQLLAGWIDRSDRITVYRCQWVLLASQTLLVLLLRQLPGKGLDVFLLYCLIIGVEITLNPMNTEISADLEHRLGHINYGAARGTGSIAFAPVSVLLGTLVEKSGTQILPIFFILCIALQAAALLLLGMSIRKANIPAASRTQKAASSSLWQFFQENRRFFGVLIGVMFLFFTHNISNNYLINIVRHVGGDTSDMGLLSGYTAVMEIPMMFLYDRLLRRFSCSATVRFAAAMFILKALALAFAQNIPALYAASLLQMFSFAMITPAMVQYVNLNIAHKDSAKGQALAFGMVTMGNILSSAVGGYLYDTMPVPAVLLIGSAAAVAGTVLCFVYTRPAAGKAFIHA